jgi:flagellin
MDVLGSANQVELNLNRTLFDQQRQVRALASGLRVNSAVDDPSGLSISETIQTRVSGLQQGVQNVQAGSNLLNVADGTLTTVQHILTRIHSLIVQSASDFNSDGDLQGIQTEINTLLMEVNKIAGNAKFNGLTLFDGSNDATMGLMPSAKIVQIRPSLNPDGSIPTPTVSNAGDPTFDPNNQLLYSYNGQSMFQQGFMPGLIQVQVVDSQGGGTSVDLKIVEYSTQSGFDGNPVVSEQVGTINWPTGAGATSGQFLAPNSSGIVQMLYAGVANLSAQDVGAGIAFETYAPPTSSSTPTGTSIQINSQGTEGGTVAINLPAITTSVLNVSGISVLRPQYVDASDNFAGEDSTNTFAAMDAENRVNNAIDLISQARATIGAQTVALQEDANDSGIQVVSQIAGESAIRDVNVGDAATAFTKDQVLEQINVSVLSQLQIDAQLVTQLVSQAKVTGSTGASGAPAG